MKEVEGGVPFLRDRDIHPNLPFFPFKTELSCSSCCESCVSHQPSLSSFNLEVPCSVERVCRNAQEKNGILQGR